MQVALPKLGAGGLSHEVLSLGRRVHLTSVLFDLVLLQGLTRDHQAWIIIILSLHHDALLDLGDNLVQFVLMSTLRGRELRL